MERYNGRNGHAKAIKEGSINHLVDMVDEKFSGGTHHGDLSAEAYYLDDVLTRTLLTKAAGLRAKLDGQPGATPPAFCFSCISRYRNGLDDSPRLGGILKVMSQDSNVRALAEAINDD